MKLTSLFIFFFCIPSFIFSQENTNKLHSKIDSIIQNLAHLESHEARVHNLVESARKYGYVSDTKRLFDKAIEIAKQTEEKRLLIQSYYSLGNYYYFNSKLDSALLYNEKAYEKLQNDDFPFLKAKVLNYKGSIYAKQGNIIAGISMMLKSKDVLQKIDTTSFTEEKKYSYKGQDLVLNNSLANFYNQMDDYEDALFYYDEAYKTALSMGASVNAGVILSNKGDLLLNFNKIPEAIKALELGKKLKIEGKGHPRSMASSDLNLAKAYLKNEDYKKSALFLKKAHDYYTANHLENMLAFTYDLRGALFLKQEKYTEAIQDGEKAQELAQKYEYLETYMNACECLYLANKKLHLYDAALLNHEKYLEAKDSIFNKKNIKKQTQLEMQFAFDKKQEVQNIEAKKKEKQRNLYLILAIIGLILASLLAFLYYKNRKKNQLLAQQKVLLESTVNDKNILLKEIHHRVKNNLQTISSLLSLQQRQISDKKASQAMQEGRDRVKAMALIHQNLYQDTDLIGVQIDGYVNKLAKSLVKNYETENKPITLNLNVVPIKLDVDTIIPLGLVINELISNALKYAFTTQSSGTINIQLTYKNNTLTLSVSDNGKGLPDSFDINKISSLGFRLIKAFSDKLKAEMQINSTNQGAKIVLIIPNIVLN
ncbi:ATP-binding protein [Polaribacter sp. MSW13]|uniref:histidine kinase n=1 Tax=Polaribacter marinus TaxID=2916838 RepID=A0A9X2AJR9_9FLAO|nr:histidine kinase dimerization/phosphoacceptor domain -containing protein [Polaribacter marinus]MCI2228688.1 ATP-binding protein [Polaribacter marinus]